MTYWRDDFVRKFTGPSFWALFDQGIVSGGMFVAGVILARTLTPADFGVYTLSLGAMQVTNSLFTAIVTYPMILKVAVDGQQTVARTTGASLIAQVMIFPVLVGILWLISHTSGVPYMPWAIIFAMGAWQLQETIRRSLIGMIRHKIALVGDTITYGSMIVILFTLRGWHIRTPNVVFITFGLTSLFGALINAIWVKPTLPNKSDLVIAASSAWKLGRWICLGNFISGIAVQCLPWALSRYQGTSSAGVFQAMLSLLGIINPVMFGLGGLIVPTAARELKRAGHQAARRVAWKQTILGLCLIGPFMVGAIFIPKQILEALYGSASPITQQANILRVLAFGYSIQFISQLGWGELLVAIGKPREVLLGQVACLFIIAGLGWVVVGQVGVWGAAIVFVLAQLVKMLTLWGLERLHSRRETSTKFNNIIVSDLPTFNTN